MRAAPLALATTLIGASGLGAASSARAEGGWVRGPAFDAIVLGRDIDGAPLQVCRASDGSARIPGKTQRGWNHCAIASGNVEKLAPSYETLRPIWLDRAQAQASKPKPSGGALGDVGAGIWDAVKGASPGLGEGGKSFGVDSDGRTPLYVCRGPHAGGVQLGKKIAGVDGCAIPYGGSEVWLKDYQVLASVGGLTVELRAVSSLPDDAVAGGQEADGTPIYPCVGAWQGGRHPGKTRRDWNACAIGFGNKEQWTTDYAVIVPRLFLEDRDKNVFPICNIGRDSTDQALGTCAASLPEGIHIGTYNIKQRTCMIPYGGEVTEVYSGYETARCPTAEAIKAAQ